MAGEGVTTRSGVYVEAIGYCPDKNYRFIVVEPRYGTWQWQSFEQVIELPAGCTFLELRPRRNATEALDRNVFGLIWFDDFELRTL